jgi:riboflavin synthase
MFTGIIEDIGSITTINKLSGKWEFSFGATLLKEGVREGDSVAADGVCLTVTRTIAEGFSADASLETLSVTTLKYKGPGDRVNLERPLRADGRFGGHMVMGHVDGVGTIVDTQQAGDSVRMTVEIPAPLSRYVVTKGSVTIDGISLTVNEQRDNIFTVNVIPFTVSKTTIGQRRRGDRVNIETDIVARYIESLIARDQKTGIDLDFLSQHGYFKGD